MLMEKMEAMEQQEKQLEEEVVAVGLQARDNLINIGLQIKPVVGAQCQISPITCELDPSACCLYPTPVVESEPSDIVGAGVPLLDGLGRLWCQRFCGHGRRDNRSGRWCRWLLWPTANAQQPRDQ